MLIYELYGSRSEAAFVKSWGVGLAVDNAQQWQNLLQSTAKAFVLLILLDMFIVPPSRWFEEHGA